MSAAESTPDHMNRILLRALGHIDPQLETVCLVGSADGILEARTNITDGWLTMLH